MSRFKNARETTPAVSAFYTFLYNIISRTLEIHMTSDKAFEKIQAKMYIKTPVKSIVRVWNGASN